MSGSTLTTTSSEQPSTQDTVTSSLSGTKLRPNALYCPQREHVASRGAIAVESSPPMKQQRIEGTEQSTESGAVVAHSPTLMTVQGRSSRDDSVFANSDRLTVLSSAHSTQLSPSFTPSLIGLPPGTEQHPVSGAVVACMPRASKAPHAAANLALSPTQSDESGSQRARRTTMLFQPCLSGPTVRSTAPSTPEEQLGSEKGDRLSPEKEETSAAKVEAAVKEETSEREACADPRTFVIVDDDEATCRRALHPPHFGRRRGFQITSPVNEEEDNAKMEAPVGLPGPSAKGEQPSTPARDPVVRPETGSDSIAKATTPSSTPQQWGSADQNTEERLLMELSDEQREAYRLVVKERRSVFITGGAGTGKSHLLRTIIQKLPRSTTFVTGTTGIAALNLGGSTVHRFAGCGIVEEGEKWAPIVARIKEKKTKKAEWCRCRTLIIDEVSMLSAYMFDLLENIARCVRGSSEPFGGIQLVLTGDFLQLPPVRKQVANHKIRGPTFAFESQVWLNVNPQVCLLSKPFRQRDSSFFDLLNEMRFGELSNATVDTLSTMSDFSHANVVMKVDGSVENAKNLRVATTTTPSRRRRRNDSGDVGPAGVAAARPQDARFVFADGFGEPLRVEFEGYTNLRPKRDEVAQQNEYYYRLLNSRGNPEYMYQVHYEGEGSFTESTVQKLVTLRAGCRVMLIKNVDVDAGLVNGSIGVVKGFVDYTKNFEFKSGNGISVGRARQVTRGMNGDPQKPHTMLPFVEFETQKRSLCLALAVEPQLWEEKRGSRIISTTTQIPLILSYAMTIHKAQGLSLTKVDIDLKSIFEAGQAYVALSRCTDLARVRLHGFRQDTVRADKSALAYYKALELYRKRTEWQLRRRQQLDQRTGRNGAAGEEEDAFMKNARDRHRSFMPCGYLPDTEGLRPVTARRARGGDASAYGRDPASRDRSETLATSSDDEGSADEFGRHVHCGQLPGPDALPFVTTESAHLEELRQYVAKLLSLSDEVKHKVTELSIPFSRVNDGTLVLDTTAIFYLISGHDSIDVFSAITARNMLRLPRDVKQYLSNIVDSLSGISEQQEGAGAQTKEEGHGDVAVMIEDNETDDGPSAMRALFQAASEALDLIEEWKEAYILDEQREGEQVTLTAANAVLPSWHKYAELLPLLQPRIPGWGATITLSPQPSTQQDGPHCADDGGHMSVSELDFLLNRDPREAVTHKGVLEYTLYLRNTFGERVAICTDSPTLAAYALASDVPVVAVGALAVGK